MADAPRLTFWGPREEPVVQGKGEAARIAAEKEAKRAREQAANAAAAPVVPVPKSK
jgi:hypothetical protein